MKRLCAWCKKDMGEKHTSNCKHADIITHGICEACAAKFQNQDSMGQSSFLDNLVEPVLYFDKEGVALTANQKAQELLKKSLPAICGFRGGNIIECIHSHEPGGCGATIHCAGCVIRKTVTDTYKTGVSHRKVPASADIPVNGQPQKVEFLISTEFFKEAVLLRIDKVKTDPS